MRGEKVSAIGTGSIYHLLIVSLEPER